MLFFRKMKAKEEEKLEGIKVSSHVYLVSLALC